MTVMLMRPHQGAQDADHQDTHATARSTGRARAVDDAAIYPNLCQNISDDDDDDVVKPYIRSLPAESHFPSRRVQRQAMRQRKRALPARMRTTCRHLHHPCAVLRSPRTTRLQPR